ncbi:hypothetical protein PILCRDRAFT_824864 [Piloderma croceum F 1598]|uniref:Uncharacterized protein n=1 Tax=Piloderma croceum (strain F 1598) TaxID=765440 RepID=A0A0C3FDE4_PILCF|nr:hypothetical protein PILCRDRAFT_824864 [Piloderma croceum F 1598]
MPSTSRSVAKTKATRINGKLAPCRSCPSKDLLPCKNKVCRPILTQQCSVMIVIYIIEHCKYELEEKV